MIADPHIKIHLHDCACRECEKPIDFAMTPCYLRSYRYDPMRVVSHYRVPSFKMELTPKGYAPDIRLEGPLSYVEENSFKGLDCRFDGLFEIVLRTSVQNPPKDRRDIFRIPAEPIDWDLRKYDTEHPTRYCGAPYWWVRLAGGSVLNLTYILTDLDTVLKVCAKPLEVLLRYHKEPIAMKSHHMLTVNVEVEHYASSKYQDKLRDVTLDIETRLKAALGGGSNLVSGYGMDAHVKVTNVQVRAESEQSGKPTNWRDVFDGNKVGTSEFEGRIEAARKAGYKFVALGVDVFPVECSRAGSQAVCKVSDLK